MKKLSTLFGIFVGVVFLCIATTSCENFMKAEEVKSQLEEMIAYANAPSYKITISYDPSEGEIRTPILGETHQKVTDVFEIKFEPAKDHAFYKWEASSTDLPAGEKIEDYIELENPYLSGTRATLKKGLTNIILKASAPALPHTEITITGSKGKFSPSKGTYTCIETYTYPLAFDPDQDYEFIAWEIYDKNNDGFTGIIENGKYIKIDDPDNSETSYSFVAAPEDPNLSIGIRPIIAERPQTLSCTPLYGVDKPIESPVHVIFDHDMDEYSIYYTKDEIDELINSGINKNDFLPSGTAEKRYGYKKKIGGKDFYYYKNITITDEGGNNILDRYKEPVFETSRILSIVPDGNNPIPTWTQINVNLDKNFYYEQAGKHITMPMSKKWVYMSTGENDETPPAMNQSSSIKIGNTTLGTSSETFYEKIKKINVDITVNDSGSGPFTTFNLTVIRADNTVMFQKECAYQNITSQSASFKGEIEISSTGFSTSNYVIKLVISDRAGKTATYNYPFEIEISTEKPPVPSALYCVEKGSCAVRVAWLPVEKDLIDNYYINYQGTYVSGTTFTGTSSAISKDTCSYVIGSALTNPAIESLYVTLKTKKDGAYSNPATFDVFADPAPDLTFFMPIEDVLSVSGRGTVATGKVERGIINLNEQVQIIGCGKVLNSVITGIEMFRKMFDTASAGDNVGLLLRGIEKTDISRGMFVIKPNEIQNHKKFKAYVYKRTLVEGGTSESFTTNFRPQFYLYTTDVTGTMTIDGADAIAAGSEGIIEVELIMEMPIFAGENFDIRYSGRTLGSGTILEIIE